MYSRYVELHCCAKIREPRFFRIAARDAFGRAQRTVQLLNYPIRKSDRVCGHAEGCLYGCIFNVDPASELGRAGQLYRRAHR